MNVPGWSSAVAHLQSCLALQFEREDQGKLQEILNKNGLQSLYPMEGIQSFLPAALAEVCLFTAISSVRYR